MWSEAWLRLHARILWCVYCVCYACGVCVRRRERRRAGGWGHPSCDVHLNGLPSFEREVQLRFVFRAAYAACLIARHDHQICNIDQSGIQWRDIIGGSDLPVIAASSRSLSPLECLTLRINLELSHLTPARITGTIPWRDCGEFCGLPGSAQRYKATRGTNNGGGVWAAWRA
jgi:hypothetical protein